MSLKSYLVLALVVVCVISLGGIGYAAFADKGKVMGSTFSIGSADIKFLRNVASGPSVENFSDELAGPTFSAIGSNWQHDYLLKLYNNAPGIVTLLSNANYLTANDPAELRQFLYVEVFPWNDIDNNGAVDIGELGTALGKKTFVKWKTEGFNLGTLGPATVGSFVFRFSTDSVSETKQGASATFDFEFASLGE